MSVDHGTLQNLGWDISFAVEAVKQEVFYTLSLYQTAAREQSRPCVIFRPSVYPDGDQWCALYGDNLQEGVAGFGDTPEAAMRQFDIEWLNARIKRRASDRTNEGRHSA